MMLRYLVHKGCIWIYNSVDFQRMYNYLCKWWLAYHYADKEKPWLTNGKKSHWKVSCTLSRIISDRQQTLKF